MKELAEDWLGEGRCVITGWKVNDGVNFWKNHYAKQKLKKDGKVLQNRQRHKDSLGV